jgi:hypothetical protein
MRMRVAVVPKVPDPLVNVQNVALSDEKLKCERNGDMVGIKVADFDNYSDSELKTGR